MTKTIEPHVFFLDDEPQVRDVVRETLEDVGIKVTCFACPTECLTQLYSQKCDLLITDLRMPNLSGEEVLQKATNAQSNLPVIILTGHGSDREEELAIQMGAFAYLRKPVDIDVLTRTMEAAYRRRRESE